MQALAGISLLPIIPSVACTPIGQPSPSDPTHFCMLRETENRIACLNIAVRNVTAAGRSSQSELCKLANISIPYALPISGFIQPLVKRKRLFLVTMRSALYIKTLVIKK